MTVRTGLIGRGMAGTVFHAPLVRAAKELELVAVAGADGAARLIADPSVELVVVATPNATHFAIADAALRAGKHVVVDKPFAISSAQADALVALAKETGRLLTIFHNRRWDGDFLTLQSLLPRLGEIMLYEAHWDRFRPAIKTGWRELPDDGAGLFFDLGPHLIDQALLLFGLPETLSADIARQREAALVDDYFHLTLHYGPRRVVLSASTLSAAPRPRFAVSGTGGAFVKHGLDPQEAALKAGADPLSPGFGSEDERSWGVFTAADGGKEPVPTLPGRYLGFYRALAAAIVRGHPPPVEPTDARAGLRIVELARRSSAEGRRLAL